MALPALPRIARLDLAVLTLPDWHPEAARTPRCPVYGYVIDHPDGAIVFDTGVGFGNAFIDEVYAPESSRLDTVLRAQDIDPESVVAVVNSHLHFDHCGQNPAFHGTGVPFYVQQSEWSLVDDVPMYTDPAWAFPPAAQRRAIDGDLTIAEGVTVLATPGHTVGHQSVVIESVDHRVVIAGQAVWEASEFVDERATESNADTPELRRAAVDSIRRIKALRPRTVYFSHCAHWEPPAVTD